MKSISEKEFGKVGKSKVNLERLYVIKNKKTYFQNALRNVLVDLKKLEKAKVIECLSIQRNLINSVHDVDQVSFKVRKNILK